MIVSSERLILEAREGVKTSDVLTVSSGAASTKLDLEARTENKN